jgi:Ribbon-helix-helix protein, copG family.
MPSNKITTTIRMEEKDYQALQKLAEEEVRSVNNLMEFIIKRFLQEHQAKTTHDS